ncbi:MAG: hypothetical protein H6898_05280 [Rhodobacter sp.]|nr:hypothetical protein [Paracoccaceae bacterium]MCC0075984.1 hypothetical protein [Rhodobacter sp.]
MDLFRSPPEALVALRLRDWGLTALIAWLAPLPMGVTALLAAWPLAAVQPAWSATLTALGFTLILGPVLGLAGVAVALALSWGLLRAGFGGWLSFALTGGGAAALAQSMTGDAAQMGLVAAGAAALLVVRLILFFLRPEIFTTR